MAAGLGALGDDNIDSTLGERLRLGHGELLRVELHTRRRRGDGDLDGSGAVEGVVVQSERQVDVVVHGLDARRQEHAVRRDGGLVGRALDLRLAAAAEQGEGARGVEIDFHFCSRECSFCCGECSFFRRAGLRVRCSQSCVCLSLSETMRN